MKSMKAVEVAARIKIPFSPITPVAAEDGENGIDGIVFDFPKLLESSTNWMLLTVI